MTILQGQFAILLVVTSPEDDHRLFARTALDAVAERFDLVIAVRQLNDETPRGEGVSNDETPRGDGVSDDDSQALTVSVHGADRPGIVHAVASALAEHGGNVVDLSTQLVGEPEHPVYVLTLRAVAPAASAQEVADAVMQRASELGVHCAVRRDDADVL